MQVRMARENEVDSLKNIWSYCFEDSQAYVDFYFDKKCDPNKVVVLEREFEIISSIHLNQHKVMLVGKAFDTSYVVGVSTLPEARGLGKMGQLMQYSLDAMKGFGQAVSILMPIDFRLYTKFGYTNVYDMKRVEMDIFDLKKFSLRDEFSRAGYDHTKDLKVVYDEFCRGLNGYALRSEPYFKDLVEEMELDGGHVYIAYRNSRPVAYIVYTIESGAFTARELYYTDRQAYESVLKFIFNHNTQAKKVVMYLAMADPIMAMLDNPKDAVCEVKNFMMARIIDFESLVEGLDIEPDLSDSDEKFYLRLEDDYLDNNRGVFEIYRQGTKVRAKRLEKDVDCNLSLGDDVDYDLSLEDDLDYDLSLTIGDLTSLMFSYMSIREVAFLRDKDVEALNRLKKILDLDVRDNHINEYV